MHVLNGCSLLPAHTCTAGQRGQTVVQTTVNYVVFNDVALHMAQSFAIEDHASRHKAKNFHAHMALTLTCKQALLSSAVAEGATGLQYRWVPGMEGTWHALTDTEAFS